MAFRSHHARILLSRAPSIAKCPRCGDDNLFRDATAEGEGPRDYCLGCGHVFPHKPGTITARQHADRTEGE